MDLLGSTLDVFMQISELRSATNNPAQDNLYVTSSYDATSHFESAGHDILDMYERIVGEKLEFNINPEEEEEY